MFPQWIWGLEGVLSAYRLTLNILCVPAWFRCDRLDHTVTDTTTSHMAMDHLYFWLAVLAGSAAIYVSSRQRTIGVARLRH